MKIEWNFVEKVNYFLKTIYKIRHPWYNVKGNQTQIESFNFFQGGTNNG